MEEIGRYNVQHILKLINPCDALFSNKTLAADDPWENFERSASHECYSDTINVKITYKNKTIVGLQSITGVQCLPTEGFCKLYVHYSCVTLMEYVNKKMKKIIAVQRDAIKPSYNREQQTPLPITHVDSQKAEKKV